MVAGWLAGWLAFRESVIREHMDRKASFPLPAEPESPLLVGEKNQGTRGPDPSSKATLWVKAQHEGALPRPCIFRKDPRVPHAARRVA